MQPLQDGTRHEGRLELITWDSEDHGLKLGFAAVVKNEEADIRRLFEEKYGGDLMKVRFPSLIAFCVYGLTLSFCNQTSTLT